MTTVNLYEQGLEKNAANHVALSPVSFVERSAEVFGELPAVIHGARRYSWRQTHERSARLAAGIGVNPSFVRKLLVPLVRDGLARSLEGKNGGTHLGRPSAEITLRDIYRSVMGTKKLWIPRPDVPHRCLVSSNVESFFEALADDAEEAVLGLLATRTLHQSLEELDNLSDSDRSSV